MPTMLKKEIVEKDRAEQELKRLLSKLRGWSKEIRTHHEEIAKRNFAIGLEISGFTDIFNPRMYPGMEITHQIAKTVGFTPGYIGIIVRVVRWLYEEKNIKSISTYMQSNKLHNWSSVVEKYFVAQGKDMNMISLSKRWYGCKSSLMNLREALPTKERTAIDRVLNRVNNLVSQYLPAEMD